MNSAAGRAAKGARTMPRRTAGLLTGMYVLSSALVGRAPRVYRLSGAVYRLSGAVYRLSDGRDRGGCRGCEGARAPAGPPDADERGAPGLPAHECQQSVDAPRDQPLDLDDEQRVALRDEAGQIVVERPQRAREDDGHSRDGDAGASRSPPQRDAAERHDDGRAADPRTQVLAEDDAGQAGREDDLEVEQERRDRGGAPPQPPQQPRRRADTPPPNADGHRPPVSAA